MNCLDYFAILAILLFLLLLLIIIRSLIPSNFRRTLQLSAKLINKLRFNSLIRFIIEFSVKLTIGSLLNLKVLNFETIGESISSLVSLIVLPLLIIFNMWTYYYILKNKANIIVGKASQNFSELHD